jgi:hypothetical protein
MLAKITAHVSNVLVTSVYAHLNNQKVNDNALLPYGDNRVHFCKTVRTFALKYKNGVKFERNTASSSAVARLRYYHLFRKKQNRTNNIFAQIVLRLQIALHVNRLREKILSSKKERTGLVLPGILQSIF